MIKMNKKTKKLLILTSIIYMLNALIILAFSYSTAKVMECAELGQTKKLPNAVLTLLGVILLGRIISLSSTAVNQWYLSSGELTLRRDIMKNILWRPIRLFRKQDDASYMNLFLNDTIMFRDHCLGSYPWLCFFIVYLIASILLLLTISPLLTIIIVALSWLPFLADKIVAVYVEKCKTDYSGKQEIHTKILKETMEGYETIRTGSSRETFLERWYQKTVDLRHSGAKLTFANTLSMEASTVSSHILRLISLTVGAVLVVKGHLTAAMLYAVIDYAGAVSNSFSNFAYYMMAIRSTKPITEKLAKETACPVEEATLEKSDAVPELEYDSVSFSFEDRPLYENLSCRFEPGKCYAVVGESGSGKSTLMKLFLKYYDTYSGVIRLNGRDIRELSEEDIYQQAVVIDQSPWLFNASLYENITMCSGKPDKDTEEYRELLAAMNLTALAERVGDNPLGDFGDKISGGERQRISLARALRNRVKLIIFDEPTTGLDPENVQLINDFIFSQKGITRIVISHDWSEDYWKRFDKVIRIGEREPVPA